LIFTALYATTGNWLLIAAYLLATAVVTIIGLALGKDPQPEEDLRLLAEARA
jgi:hypothetical protein